MTDEAPTFCVRGCTRKGQLQPDGEHAPDTPVEASTGLLCKRDTAKLRDWIAEIPDLYATLDTRMDGGMSSRYDGKTHAPGKLSHSPALIRLEVAALMDRRTLGDPDDPESRDPVYVPLVVTGWAALFAEETNLESPTGTITEACNLLAAWLPQVAGQLWIDEMWGDFHKVSRLLHAAHGIRGPQPRGHCQECGHRLYAEEDATSIRCPGCRITYTGINILLNADSREQAEKGLGVG
jgi:hypothetical protein